MATKPDLRLKLRLGFIVFGVLMVLEVAEYIVGTRLKSGAWPYLGILATIAAWPILQYFMHILELWRRKEK